MGLFGSKKVYVSSSVYNLAGDEIDRPNFLKSSLFSAVMNPYDAYLGEVIVGNYLTGPGIMQRSFFNWAVRNDVAGMPTLSVRNSLSIDPAIITPVIPLAVTPVGLETHVQSSQLTDGDFTHWAEQYILANAPEENNSDWIADYNETTHEITIQYEGGGTVTFGATNFDKDKQFVIAQYYQSVPTEEQPLVTGSTTTGDLTPPSIAGYTLDDTTNTGVIAYTLNQVVEETKVYSNGDPDVVTITYPAVPATFNGIQRLYIRTDYNGGNGVSSETSQTEKFYYLTELREVTSNATGFDVVVVNDLGGGETETVTTNTSGQFLTEIYDWREDTQETLLEAIVETATIYIYEIGTGEPTLDALVDEQAPGGAPEYYPFIPIRLNNKSILHADYDDNTGSGLYAESKKAYRKATRGQNILDIIEEVEDNPDIGDIDYSYIQWGVSVNVIEPACRRYMYEFFRNLIPHQNTSAATITSLKANVDIYNGNWDLLNAWTAAQNDFYDPLYGTPAPSQPNIGDPETTTVRLQSDHAQLGGFDNRYTWVMIEENNFTGLGKVDAESGDIWFEEGETYSWSVRTGTQSLHDELLSSIFFVTKSLKQTMMFKQTSATTYSRLNIWGMVHHNYIYGGKSVRTTLQEGIDDLTASVFIIPLHAPTVKSLGIVDFTQMATANTWITFNSYLVVKKKWYQTFLGMLLIIIAIVVLSVLISPAGAGAATGVFGTNAAVGAGLGLTGTSAIIAGAVTNAIAAIVIAQAISTVSVKIFGEKWGAIIGAIVGFVVSFGITNGFSSFNLSTMMNPQTILQFTSALANGYNGFVLAEIGEINAEMENNQGVYDKAVADLENLMREQGLINDLLFDPLALTDSVKGNGAGSGTGDYTVETVDGYVGRTLMSGSDIADLTLSMVSEYSDLQLTLPRS